MRRITLATACVLAGVALTGCVSPSKYPAAYARYTVEDIVGWSRAGVPDKTIIARLSDSGGFYPLTASELIDLHTKKGVSLAVLDYMQDTYVRAIRLEERFQMPRRFHGAH